MNERDNPICRTMPVPDEQLIAAAEKAREINPTNVPDGAIEKLKKAQKGGRLALGIRTLWHKSALHLTVGFLDGPEPELRRLMLSHMNAWGEKANVAFEESSTDPVVRIARFDKKSAEKNRDGYWSYVGTDILVIAKDKPTMNLEGFTLSSPDSEFRRVVRHEAGHTLGFEHEHMRQGLIDRLDVPKVIEHYMRTEGWTEEEVRRQVLTPIEESSGLGTSTPDPNSIMCYFVEPFLTIDFKAIPGGVDITELDHDFAARIYPK